MMVRKHFLFLLILTVSACKIRQKLPEVSWTSIVEIFGRTEIYTDTIILLGSASGVEFMAQGDSIIIEVINVTEELPHNYISISIDNDNNRRYRLTGHTPHRIGIVLPKRDTFIQVGIYKSTEAQVGEIAVHNIEGRLKNLNVEEKPKIEFIGNSITCAMGADHEYPCDSDQWYDQHRAYFSYASILGRELDVDVQLSSVSGSGIYRNWNSDGPTVPQVYGQLNLDMDTSRLYNFNSFTPDLISICLGTNDLSEGDGIKERLPFDSRVFISTYIEFVEMLYSHYPEAKIILLNSPMVGGDKNEILKNSLNKVKDLFHSRGKDITTYFVDSFDPGGCSYHPDLDDHRRLATILKPVMAEFLYEQ